MKYKFVSFFILVGLLVVSMVPGITLIMNNPSVTPVSGEDEGFIDEWRNRGETSIDIVSPACNFMEETLPMISNIVDDLEPQSSENEESFQLEEVEKNTYLEFESKFFENFGEVKLTIYNKFTNTTNFFIQIKSPSIFMTIKIGNSGFSLFSQNQTISIAGNTNGSILLYFDMEIPNDYSRFFGMLNEFNYTIFTGDIEDGIIYQETEVSSITWLKKTSRLDALSGIVESDNSKTFLNYTFTYIEGERYLDLYIKNKLDKDLNILLIPGLHYTFSETTFELSSVMDKRFQIKVNPIIPLGINGGAMFDEFRIEINSIDQPVDEGVHIFDLFTTYTNIGGRTVVEITNIKLQIYESSDGTAKELQVAIELNAIEELDQALKPIIEGMELGLLVKSVQNQFQPLRDIPDDINNLKGEPFYVWICYGADLLETLLLVTNPWALATAVVQDYLLMRFESHIDQGLDLINDVLSDIQEANVIYIYPIIILFLYIKMNKRKKKYNALEK